MAMSLSTRQPRLSSAFNLSRSLPPRTPYIHSYTTTSYSYTSYKYVHSVYVSERGCVSVCPFHSPHFNQQIIKSLAEEALTTTPNILYICMYCHVRSNPRAYCDAASLFFFCFSFVFPLFFFLITSFLLGKPNGLSTLGCTIHNVDVAKQFHISPSGINAFLHYHTNPPSFLSPWRTRLLMTSSDCYIFFFTDKASTTNILNGRNQLAAFDTAYSKVSFFPTKFCHLPAFFVCPIQDVDIPTNLPQTELLELLSFFQILLDPSDKLPRLHSPPPDPPASTP